MELDELKKSWNALDAQLQKEPIADEKQIKELIASYKTNTRLTSATDISSMWVFLFQR